MYASLRGVPADEVATTVVQFIIEYSDMLTRI